MQKHSPYLEHSILMTEGKGKWWKPAIVLKPSAERSIVTPTHISLAKASPIAMPAINGGGKYIPSTKRSAANHIARGARG